MNKNKRKIKEKSAQNLTKTGGAGLHDSA